MKLVIVRHGDPDYSIDSLTEKGWKEAELLSHRLSKLDIKDFYCSPMGRAKDTASFTLKAMNREAKTLRWLREYQGSVFIDGEKTHAWDRLPSQWLNNDDYFHPTKWMETPLMQSGNVKKKYERVANGIDRVLAEHGYVHDGKIFRAEKPNHDTIVMFCHFGVEVVMLSHIFGCSPMVLWHNFVALPTSVTTLVTEEREEGIAVFRATEFGDTSHLYAADEEPAFAARFCECYTDDTRH